MSGAAGDKLFFTRTSLPPTSSTLPLPHRPPPPGSSTSSTLSEEYLLGIMVGLACYNGVLVNLPLVDIVYKLFYGGKVKFLLFCYVIHVIHVEFIVL